MIRIAAHQRGEIEGDAEARPAGRQQRLVATVGLLRRTEPGKLPHRPELAAVAGLMNPTRVRESARFRDVASGIDTGEILSRVETLNRTARDGREGRRPFAALFQ